MTNTERLIDSLRIAQKAGFAHLDFRVGKYTGNGSAVVAALRRRGYTVKRNSYPGSYRLHPLPTTTTN